MDQGEKKVSFKLPNIKDKSSRPHSQPEVKLDKRQTPIVRLPKIKVGGAINLKNVNCNNVNDNNEDNLSINAESTTETTQPVPVGLNEASSKSMEFAATMPKNFLPNINNLIFVEPRRIHFVLHNGLADLQRAFAMLHIPAESDKEIDALVVDHKLLCLDIDFFRGNLIQKENHLSVTESTFSHLRSKLKEFDDSKFFILCNALAKNVKEFLRLTATRAEDEKFQSLITAAQCCLSRGALRFIRSLTTLDDLLLVKLQSSASDLKNVIAYQIQITAKLEGMKKTEDELKRKLDARQKSMVIEVKRLDAAIEKTTQRLHSASNAFLKKMKMRDVAKESEKTKLERESNELQTKYEERQQSMTKELVVVSGEHMKREGALREKKFKIETEIGNWIDKYDRDLTRLDVQYDVVKAEYDPIRKRLDEMEIEFARVEAVINEINARIAEEERTARAAKDELAHMNRCAMVIQGFWRTRFVLKALKKKGRGKKKK